MEKIVSNKNFLTQAVETTGFPFEIKRQIEQEKFRDADDVISDMRSKYGL